MTSQSAKFKFIKYNNLKSIFFIKILVVVLLINANNSSAQTTIINQNFAASAPSGWTSDVSSWSLNYSYPTNDHTPNDYCASIADGKPSKYIYIPITMMAGAKYDISFWTKRLGAVTVYINETADQVTPLFTYTGTQTLDNNWKQTTCTSYIALTSGQFYLQIAYTGSTYGNGAAYLDDIKVTETSAGNQNSWSITGSSGTNMVSNFIGTTDAQGLVFKTNNIERAQFDLNGNFVLSSGAYFKDKIKLEKGFTFDGLNGLTYIPKTSNTGEIIHLGNNQKILPVFQCQTPNSQPWNQFYYNGNFVTYMPAGSSSTFPLVNAALSIGIAPWNGNGLIEVSGVDALGAGNNGLEINTFCKRNTFINCGWDLNPTSFVNGGRVNMGAEVEMMRSLKIGWNGTPSVIDPKTAIEINQNTDNAKGVNVKTWNSSIKAFAIEYLDGTNGFVVNGDGRTIIRTDADNAFDIVKKTGETVNFRVKSSGVVYAREVNVMIGTYPDYVFKKEYKLTPLEEVEKYIKENHRLKGFEKASFYEKNGANLGELVRLQQEKIEELTLYLIQLKKEIESLKK